MLNEEMVVDQLVHLVIFMNKTYLFLLLFVNYH